jgi:PPM family protein phosphatase
MRSASGKGAERRNEVRSLRAVYYTDRGKVRQLNEDNGGIFRNSYGDVLAIVADGMGGHQAGEVASEMTISLLQQQWEATTEPFETPQMAEQWLNEQIKYVNDKVFEYSTSHKECEGMGTTLVAAICTEKFVTIAHIGDSRGYIYNEQGIRQLTEDHSLVNELVRTGQISKEDAEHHPRKNILLRALGTEEKVEVELKTIAFEEGDFLLLCSDGLSNKVTEDEMRHILDDKISIEEKGKTLIQMANDNGGEDNITLVIIEFAADSESG